MWYYSGNSVNDKQWRTFTWLETVNEYNILVWKPEEKVIKRPRQELKECTLKTWNIFSGTR
jgi:hypothetical protein